MKSVRIRYCVVGLAGLLAGPSAGGSGAPSTPAARRNAPPPPHGFFSRLARIFARVERLDPAARTLTFVEDASGEARTRLLPPDVDVFINELPAEVSSLHPGQRVWIAMDGPGRDPGAIRFIADEPSYQALHGAWHTVERVDLAARRVVLSTAADGVRRETELEAAVEFQLQAGSRQGGLESLRPGLLVRYQTGKGSGGYVLTHAHSQLAWALNLARQRAVLDDTLARSGLPGEVREADGLAWAVLVYRVGSDWARGLQAGDRVALRVEGLPAAVPGEVVEIGPWGEKTRVLLRVSTALPAAVGRPVRLEMPRPPRGKLPPGLGVARDADVRVEWFLSTVYCTCPIMGDRCTGHLYTLSMCHPTGCAKPAAMRRVLGDLIRQGLSDAEVLRRLEEVEGPELLRPHLLK